MTEALFRVCEHFCVCRGPKNARHRLADGLGVIVRDSGHVIALDSAAMATATSGRPHRRTERLPPGLVAKAPAAQLLRFNETNAVVNE